MDQITASMRAGEIMQEFPELTDLFVDLGICGCNDGHESDLAWTVSKIAREKGLDLDQLLEKLNRLAG